MKNIILKIEDLEWLKELSDQDRWELLIHILEYHKTEKEPEIKNIMQKFAFKMMKPYFDLNIEKYKNICDRNKENGLKWWRPIQNPENPVGYLETQNNPKNLKSKSKSKSKSKNIINDTKVSLEQSSTEIIPKEDKRDLDIDLIIESIKNCNEWIIDDQPKNQRRYWKMIKNKINKIKWFERFNNEYNIFISFLYDNSDQYRKNYFRSLEKFYRNLSNIIAWIKINHWEVQKKGKITVI